MAAITPVLLVLGCLQCLAVLNIWVLIIMGYQVPIPHLSPYWHPHEMFFGYTMAIASAGLLRPLTLDTRQQRCFAHLLVASWLGARLGFLLDLGIPHLVIALLDLAFVPLFLLLWQQAPSPRRSAHYRWAVVGLYLALAIANAGYHLEILGLWPLAGFGQQLAFNGWIILLLVVADGLLFPTAPARPRHGQAIAHSLGAAGFVAANTIAPFSAVAGLTAVAVAVTTGCRAKPLLGRFRPGLPLDGHRIIALGVVGTGLGFAALACGSLLAPGQHRSLIIHTFTVFGTGILTLGILVSLFSNQISRNGPTNRWWLAATLMMVAAGLLRVVGPLVYPAGLVRFAHYAAGFWCLALLLLLYKLGQSLYLAWRQTPPANRGT